MSTKGGKHHFQGTLVYLDASGNEIRRREGYTFTAKNPEKFVSGIRGRYPGPEFLTFPWVSTRIENLIDLDA